MFKIHFTSLMMIVLLILTQATIQAQEFPVAVGSDTTFSGGAVYGGENGIVAILGDSYSQYSVNAQLVGAGGTLIGSRISLGAFGVMPSPVPIFDGTNYFLVWLEFNGNLKGQFINTSGELVGSSFNIATDVSVNRRDFKVVLGDDTMFVGFVKNDNYLYGQRVSKTGNLVGSQIQISYNLARDISIAYDGINYLVAWVEQIQDTDKDIFGQFVSKTGSLVGSNFLIDGGPYYSDNPTSLAFDGTRYLLAFHETTSTSSKWTLFGRFVTTTGTIGETITICDSSTAPGYPCVAFDNINYLITWGQQSNGSLMGRFYNTSGVPINEPFVIFGPSENKISIGGVGFGGNLYLAVATKVNSAFSDGDVYARFIQPLTGVESENNLLPDNFVLHQNYPNPFNPVTNITFSLPSKSFVSVKIFDLVGREVSTVISEELTAGNYSYKWNAKNLTSGMYFYRIQAGNYTETKKLVLLK